MALDDLIRKGVAVAKSTVNPLLVEVSHTPVTGRDQHGPTYGDPVTRLALVEDVGEPVIGNDGVERQAQTKLTFLESIHVDLLDTFEVNGVVGQVAKRAGLLAPNGDSYYTEVWLGQNVR